MINFEHILNSSVCKCFYFEVSFAFLITVTLYVLKVKR